MRNRRFEELEFEKAKWKLPPPMTAEQYQKEVNEMAKLFPMPNSFLVMSQQTLDKLNAHYFTALKNNDVMGTSRLLINDSLKLNEAYKIPYKLKDRKMKNTCHANNCKYPIKPSLFMCRKHWNMVNKELKMELYKHYRKGQEIDKEPSEAYVSTARKCIDSVALVEASQIQIEKDNPK